MKERSKERRKQHQEEERKESMREKEKRRTKHMEGADNHKKDESLMHSLIEKGPLATY